MRPSKRMFPTTATIESPTSTQDEEGGLSESWAATFTDVPCQFSAFSPGSSSRMTEVRDATEVFVSAEYRAILEGDLDIHTSDRCLVMDQTFDIRGVERDAFQLVTTLRLEGAE